VSDTWYYVDGHGRQVGPLTLSKLKEACGTSSIVKIALVWRDGFPDWRPPNEVPELHVQTAVPRRLRRKHATLFKGTTLIAVGFWGALLVVALVAEFYSQKADNEARLAGWAGHSERAQAEKAGFSDPAAWRAKLAADDIAARRAEREADAVKAAEASKKAEARRQELIRARYTTCGERGNIDASVMSEQFVRDRLKAPSTAEFPRGTYGVTWAGGCTFKVNSYVDAQNGFGVKLRNKYYAELEYLPEEDKWRLKNLRMD
jgi:hypothetical protein